jgi:hypothetical protein
VVDDTELVAGADDIVIVGPQAFHSFLHPGLGVLGVMRIHASNRLITGWPGSP